MKIRNTLSMSLFFSLLFVTNYSFCQHSGESANNNIKVQPTATTPAATASTKKEAASAKAQVDILQDVKRISDEHPQESTANKIKVQPTQTTPASTASAQKEPATGKEDQNILQDVKRVSDEHPQELTDTKIKVQPTLIAPAATGPVQKQLPAENQVKPGAAKKSQVNSETAAGKGEQSILQDVKRVSDEHP